jgi:Zn-finger protein
MKYNSFFKLLTFAFVCAILATSCVKEGPAGKDGINGQDGAPGANGADGNVTCLECHNTGMITEKEAQFWMSEHSVGAIAVDYAGGRASCAPCHSHELFVQTMIYGSVAGDVTNPSAWKCSTCHGIHEDFEGAQDFALRSNAPIHPNFDPTQTMDLTGNSNLCAICHQSRVPEPSVATPGETFKISSTHYGPHHGPQSNVVAGVGFAEIDGSVSYPTSTNKHLEMASCTGCHMAGFEKNDFEVSGKVVKTAQGGHSFIPSVKACNDCHGTSETNYDYSGVQTEVAALLEEIRDQLVELGVVEYLEEDAAYEPIVGTYPMIQAQAYFNWIGIEEDRSLGVHNPKYVKALLLNTKQALEAEIAAN